MLLAVARAYSEPHRTYHVLSHPVQMISEGMKSFDDGLSNEQILAIWYHDYIYCPGSSTNELYSAAAFTQHFENDKTIIVDVVQKIILDTKNHIPSIPESEKVIDLDLMGLGASFHEYRNNAINIRKEYAEFSDEEWIIGRKKFIEKMLGRESIFYTKYGKNLEDAARRNLEDELKLLMSNDIFIYI